MDGLSGKDFFGGSVFPDNKAFRKLRFARCMKKWQPFGASLSNTELLEICQKWAQKKQQIFFGFTASCAAAERRDIQFFWWFCVATGSCKIIDLLLAFRLCQAMG